LFWPVDARGWFVTVLEILGIASQQGVFAALDPRHASVFFA
jgi:hypothetical protein